MENKKNLKYHYLSTCRGDGGAENSRPESPSIIGIPSRRHTEHNDTIGGPVARREQPEVSPTPPKGSIGIIGGKLTRTIRSSIRSSVMVIEAMAEEAS